MADSKRQKSGEPWSYDGRNVLDAAGAPLATTADPEDARRIVAAVNAVQGMPTEALESWTVEVVADPALESDIERPREPGELYPGDRRSGRDRRQDDRRQGRLNAPSPLEVSAPEDRRRRGRAVQ